MKKRIFPFLALIGVLFFVQACAPMTATRGNMLEDYQLAELEPGKDTPSTVLRKLGSPTTRAPFEEHIWFYLGQETEKRGILDPEVIRERIVKLEFDPETLTLAAYEEVDPNRLDLPYSRAKTETPGTDSNVVQDFFGNLGRFNQPVPE